AAFATLPERWQLVLWHTEVEGRAPKEVAPLIGLEPNAVAALAYRAREGLRQAYLQAHLQTPHEAGCAECVPSLAAYVRNGLSDRDRRAVDEHLLTCEVCRELVAELQDTNGMLRTALLPAIAGVPAAAYLSQAGTKGVVAWFGRLSRLQQAGAASSAAAAAVVAGVMTAAVVSTSGTDPTAAAAPPSTRAAVTTVVDSTVFGETPETTAPGTTVVVTTVPAETTGVPTTADLTSVNRVPLIPGANTATSTPAAPSTTAPAADSATTTSTTSPPAVAARLTLSSVQIGVALLGGQVRIGLTVSASVLPSVSGAPFSDLVVAVPLPSGVQLASVDNPGWVCTIAATCTIASLASGASTNAVLTLDVAANVTAPITLSPTVTNPPGADVQSLPLPVATQTVAGLIAQRFDKGSVTAIGDTVLTCVAICLPAASSEAALSVAGAVTKAVLVWSGVSNALNRGQVSLTTPEGAHVVTADDLLSDYSSQFPNSRTYVAYADVTDVVTSSGTYGVTALQTQTGLDTYGGWSLVVLTHDDAKPLRSLLIAMPFAYVTDAAPYDLDLSGIVTPTSDAHVIASAFEGTSGMLGGLNLNGFSVSNPFGGLISSAVDLLDVTAVDVGGGS
ncbi:MAG TPA: zf-HC2 domain-containing protein, partial [Ilumatobacteraceae bacterium]